MAGYSTRQCPVCKQTSKFRTDYQTCCLGGRAKGIVPVPESSSLPSSLTGQDKLQVELEKLRIKKSGHSEQLSILQDRVLQLEEENAALVKLSGETPQIFDVPARESGKKSESAAVVVWSDHHLEEEVKAGAVGNKNEHNLQIHDQRFLNLLYGTLAWLKIESAKTTIKTLVVALLGDFITGNIHEELMESNLLLPVDAAYKAQSDLISGLKYLRDNTPPDVEIIAVCHSGNHGRITKKQRISTETGNSLEHFMYYTMRDYFKNEPRIKFIIATGYHSFVRFFEGRYEIRFHHGHQINYQGGVGGITIPVNKAIAQWNKAHAVNLDVFGHFHTRFDGGNFIANGSLIGYNAYAVSIKASYERPSQTFFLVNREFEEKTMVAPIFVEHGLPADGIQAKQW